MRFNLIGRLLSSRKPDTPLFDFEAVYDQLPVPVAILDDAFRFQRVNKAFEHVFQFAPADIVGREDPIVSGLVAKAAPPRHAMPATQGSVRLATKVGRKLEVNLKVSRLDLGSTCCYLLLYQDVQELGESSRLQLSRPDMFRMAIEQSPVPITIQDERYRITLANAAACELLGMTQEELIGADPSWYYAPESLADGVSGRVRAEERHADGEAFTRITGVRQFLNPRTGEKVAFRLSATRMVGLNGEEIWCAMLFDLRETESLERQLRAQIEWLERAFDNAPVGMVLTRADGSLVRYNKTLEKITGLREPEALHALAFKVQAVPEAAARTATEVVSTRFSLENGNGSMQWLDGYAARVTSAAGEAVTITVINDATREHLLKTELTASLMQQSALLRCMDTGMAHLVGEVIVQVNPALLELVGCAEAQVLGQPLVALFGDHDRWSEHDAKAREALGQNGLYRTTESIMHSDGTARRCEIALRRVNAERAELGVLVTFTDVSELLEQADLLRQSIDDIRVYSNTGMVGVATLDAGRLVHANEAMLALLARTQDQVTGSEFTQYCDPATDSDLVELLRAPDGVPRETVSRVNLVREDLSLVDCLLHAMPATGGQRPLVTVVAVDLSQRNVALSLAVRMHLRFDAFAASLNEAVLVLSPISGKIAHANRASKEIFGLEPEELIRLSSARLWSGVAADSKAALDQALADLAIGKPSVTVVSIQHSDGHDMTVRLRMFGGGPGHHERYLLAEDISEERQQERKRLEEAVAQRETLVREVHHRIKNNLQGVAGLLQQTAIRHPELMSALADVVSQIHAIAQVHGLQFQHQESLRPSEIVAAIADNLRSNFGQRLECVDKIGPDQNWVLPEGEAVPLALVINELMTNAFKHSRDAAMVKVTISSNSGGIMVRVANTGQLPLDFDYDKERMASSGLGLIKALIPRRGASIRFEQRSRWVIVSLSLSSPALEMVVSTANLAQSEGKNCGIHRGDMTADSDSASNRSTEGVKL